MPIKVSYDDRVRSFRIAIANPISVDELVTEYRQVFDDPNHLPNVPSLWDLTALDLGRIPLSDIRQLPRALGELVASRGDSYKVALVCSRMVDYQLLRVYLGIIKLIGSNMKLRLFRDMKSAEQWVSADGK